MKIGVIADTHLRRPNTLLQAVAERYFAHVDLILHAGDLCTPEVLSVFSGKTVYVVSGNRDNKAVKKTYPETAVISVSGKRIGLVHGWGSSFSGERRVERVFDGVDGVVFGHTHRPFNRHLGGVLYFNPGAFHRSPLVLWRRSIGILTVEKEGINGRIIRLPDAGVPTTA